MNKDYIFNLPNLGEGVSSAEISEVPISIGQKINKTTTIVVLESEKASMEIPAEAEGTVKEIYISKGETVKTGDKIISLNLNKETEVSSPKTQETQKQKEENTSETNKKLFRETKTDNFRTSPSVRKLSRELNINLNNIKGSGNKGRITREDLIEEIKKRMTKPQKEKTKNIDFSKWGPIKEKTLTKIKIITGSRMEEAWKSVPQVTQFNKADITEIDIKRKKDNTLTKNKTTILPFIIMAVIKALQKYSLFNSSLSFDKKQIIEKKYFNIGVAVNTKAGLMVPVIKSANNKTLKDLAKEIKDISFKAEEGKLKPGDFQGGTFTVSSLGGVGGTYFSPIVNPPEVAILGVSRSRIEAVYSKNNKVFVPRNILPFSLTYDHRVIDGMAAAEFTQYLKSLLSEPLTFKQKK